MHNFKEDGPQQLTEKSEDKFVGICTLPRMRSMHFLRWPWPPWAAALQAAKINTAVSYLLCVCIGIAHLAQSASYYFPARLVT